MVHAVDQVHVGEAPGFPHPAVPFREPESGVAREVALAHVRLHFHQAPANDRTVVEAPAERGAEKVPRDRRRIPPVELRV